MKEADYAAICEKAAEIIEEQGWTRGAVIHEGNGRVCLQGALGVAAGIYEIVWTDRDGVGRYDYAPVNRDGLGMSFNNDFDVANAAVYAYLQKYMDFEGMYTHQWNDNCVTVGSEVSDVLKRTAKEISNGTLSRSPSFSGDPMWVPKVPTDDVL